MATTRSKSAGKQLEEFIALIVGLTGAAPAGQATLGVGGKSFTIAELVLKLSGYRDTYQVVGTTHGVYLTALQTRNEAETEAGTFLDQARKAVQGALGEKNVANNVYGIKTRKPPTPLTAEQLLARKAKSEATRLARGTLGKKQKKLIHGVVSPAVPPPIVVPKPG